MLPAGNVLVANESGTIIEIIEAAEAGDDVQQLEGTLCPGFINAHCHLELSHLKEYIPEKTGLSAFILKVVFERNFEQEKILAAIETAENEMLQNGIVAVGDICNNLYTLTQKRKNGLRYHNFIEASGFEPSVAESRFQQSINFYKEYARALPSNSIVPHAPYSVSQELFQLINEFSNNNVLTIHNQETAAEGALFKNKEGEFLAMFKKMNTDISFFEPSGKSSLQTFLPQLKNYQSLLLVHNVCTNKEDILFEKQRTINEQSLTSYCLCPNANSYISGLQPNVYLLMEQQCHIVLGTDSLASNNQLSILEEIKTLHKNFPGIPVASLLQWATSNGAKALQMDQELGSFDKGKKPGIVLIEGMDETFISATAKAKTVL